MFFDRLQSLCARDDTDVSRVLRGLGLSTSKGTAWKGGAIPKGDILLKLANYFHVSTDYLLGNTDDPSPVGQKEPPRMEAEAVGPNKRALLDSIADMSEAEAAFALDFIKKIKSIRG